MGVMIGVGVVIASVVGSVCSQILSDEAKSWLPRVAEFVIRRAVSKLPSSLRERLAEEWRSHITEIPGPLSKFVVSIGFWVAARKIRSPRLSLREKLRVMLEKRGQRRFASSLWGRRVEQRSLRQFRSRMAWSENSYEQSMWRESFIFYLEKLSDGFLIEIVRRQRSRAPSDLIADRLRDIEAILKHLQLEEKLARDQENELVAFLHRPSI